jgi:predicted dehydrogenase
VTFQFALIGCGARGKMWTQIIDRMDDATIVAFVDGTVAHAKALAEPRAMPAFEDLEKALEATAVDAVLVVTPPATHRTVIERLLRFRLPILAEKPLADELPDAIAVVRGVEAAGVPMSLSVQFRYLPVSQKIRELMVGEAYGKPGFAQFTYFRNRDPYAPNLNWGTRYPGRVRHPMLVDQSIHHFDLIRYCYSSEPIWIQANTWNPTWSPYAHDSNVASFMELANGVKVQYLGTWTGGWNEMQFEWRTDCERGIVTQRQLFNDLFVARTEESQLTPVRLKPFDAFYDDSTALLRAFIAAVRSGAPVPCDGRDHLQTLAMVFAAIESAASGGRVDMADFRRRTGIEAVLTAARASPSATDDRVRATETKGRET